MKKPKRKSPVRRSTQSKLVERPWPEILTRLSLAENTESELQEFKDLLRSDSAFRERFCDWIRVLRHARVDGVAQGAAK